MSKIKRHKSILTLINENIIETQQELTDLLIKLGYKVTQATISRDIKELGLVKESYDGKTYYMQPLY